MMTINNTESAPREALGLYIHIPFCIRKCNYCDFLSFGGTTDEEQNSYFKALFREIEHYSYIYGNKYYVDSIFIGGGTPSLVDEGLIQELMAVVRSSFSIDQNAEISIESNPKTLNKKKLDTYIAASINRLSIGAQSFNENLLSAMGRVHSPEDILANYALARECGFRNINLDLMFAIPGQTKQVWLETLNQVIKLEPEHISFYSLQLEEGTPYFSMFQEGSLIEIEDELDREMYHEAITTFKDRGYYHYEISNVSKEGYQCRHNLKYWSMADYLGLGLGSHSYMEGVRFSNITNLKEYVQAGGNKASVLRSPFAQWRHKNTKEENISEYIFTGMRKLEGINLRDFEARFEKPIEDVFSANWHRLQKYIDEGYLIKSDAKMHFSLKGIDISNTILTEFV